VTAGVLRHPVLHRALAMFLGAIFLYASIEKIAYPQEFARIVYHYQLVGPNQTLGFVPANAVAFALPWIEALCGSLLLLGLWRREAAMLCALLLAVFVLAVGSAMVRGIDIENCGCFSVKEGRSASGWLIAGDLGMLAAALFLAFGPEGQRSAAATGEPSHRPPSLIIDPPS
jgi:putative oxidoreductase